MCGGGEGGGPEGGSGHACLSQSPACQPSLPRGLSSCPRRRPLSRPRQVELHPLLAQRKLVGVCMRKVGVLSTSLLPLVSSFLAARPPTRRAALPLPPDRLVALQGVHSVAYSPLGHSKEDLVTHPVVLDVAAEAGKTAAQVSRQLPRQLHLTPCWPGR